MRKLIVLTIVLAMSSGVYGAGEMNNEIPAGTATIDGLLGDWAGATWQTIDIVGFFGSNVDMSNGLWTARWDSAGIYAAVTWTDTDHFRFNDMSAETGNGLGLDEVHLGFIPLNNGSGSNRSNGYQFGYTTSLAPMLSDPGINGANVNVNHGFGKWWDPGIDAAYQFAVAVSGDDIIAEVFIPSLTDTGVGTARTAVPLSAGQIVQWEPTLASYWGVGDPYTDFGTLQTWANSGWPPDHNQAGSWPQYTLVPAADTDSDGVYDQDDLCPNTPPATQVNADGCPDEDGDGVTDTEDNCLGTAPGTWVDEYGCAVPDSDGDGVYDPCDACPGTPPGAEVNSDGCPDADSDGVVDADDLCPGTAAGALVNADGCPDADGDGVTDADDLCPGTPGGTPVDVVGCPFATEFTAVMAVSASQWGDYNNDGFSDMFGGNNVYTNQGDGTFVHTTPLGGRSRGSLGDFNNDGLLDAFSMAAGSGITLWTNDGDETWTDRSAAWFTPGVFPTNSNASTVVDLNGDGFLDTYMTGWWNEDSTSVDVIYTSYTDGVADPCWTHTWTYGPPWQQKGVTACDFDEDSDQDLYVSGYWWAQSSLWRNDGFNGYTGLYNAVYDYGASSGPGHTQGSCWADFDNDGHFDLFVANFAHPGNPTARFLENQGAPDYHFTNKGLCGVRQVEPLSAGIAGDYDNDGHVDLLVTTSSGYGAIYIMLFRNNGDWTFTETTSAMGLAGLGPRDEGAWGDYNNDGYLDLIANGQLWRNPGGPNHWLKVKLLGGPHADGLVNGSAIGAQVRIDVPGLGTLVRQVEGNTGQLGSQNDLTMHFGLGSYSGTVDLDISWPNGYEETIYGVGIDQREPLVIKLGDPRTCADVISMGYRLDGDFDGDCDVTVDDLIVLAGLWLADCGVADCSVVDTDGSSTVDLDDFGQFSDNLGLCNEPFVAGCTTSW